MAVTYTDNQIDALVQERKPLPANWRDRTRMKAKRGHDEQHLDATGEIGTGIRLIFRQSRINGLDFSIILAVLVPQSTQVFRLRRLGEAVPEERVSFSWNDPIHDPHGMYVVDCRVNGMLRPLFVHALGSDGRTRDDREPRAHQALRERGHLGMKEDPDA